MNIIKRKDCLYIFNCAFRYRSNELNRKRTLRNKNLKSLFQNYNLTYFSKHFIYNKFDEKMLCQLFTCWYAIQDIWMIPCRNVDPHEQTHCTQEG